MPFLYLKWRQPTFLLDLEHLRILLTVVPIPMHTHAYPCIPTLRATCKCYFIHAGFIIPPVEIIHQFEFLQTCISKFANHLITFEYLIKDKESLSSILIANTNFSIPFPRWEGTNRKFLAIYLMLIYYERITLSK